MLPVRSRLTVLMAGHERKHYDYRAESESCISAPNSCENSEAVLAPTLVGDRLHIHEKLFTN